MISTLRAGARTFLREPLVHLLAIGACIYVAYGVAAPPEPELDERTLTVRAAEVEWLKTSWARRWHRPPTERELDGLISEYVKETVLYREALAMGLDRDDPIIRRRLAQKLTFLTQDLLQPAEPTDEALRAHFEESAGRYREPDLLTFTHVFVDPDKRGNRTLDDARAIKASLEAADPASARGTGDRFMLQAYYPQRTQSEIGRLFGSEFGETVAGLEPGAWHGPVLSGYGVHLVYVHDRTVSPAPSFDAVRDTVREDWVEARRSELNARFVEDLLARYEVVIEEEGATR